MFTQIGKIFILSVVFSIAFKFISPSMNTFIVSELTTLFSKIWALDSFVDVSQVFQMLRYFMLFQIGIFTILIYKLVLPGKNA
jgi:hypothetical protein